MLKRSRVNGTARSSLFCWDVDSDVENRDQAVWLF
jgi:hypothetical protein